MRVETRMPGMASLNLGKKDIRDEKSLGDKGVGVLTPGHEPSPKIYGKSSSLP